MKIIPILLFTATLLLCGCQVLFVPTWQEREYNDLIEIAAESTRGTCSVQQTQKLLDLSTHLVLYTEYLPHNTKLNTGAVKLDKMIQELYALPQPIGRVYCTFKLRIIHAMATSLAAASGSKP